MFKEQKETIKKIFALYENFVVMGCEGNPQMYARPIIETIPELIKAFPSIVVEMDDSFGILKSILMKKYNHEN